jgi:hypothetical protein
MTGSLLAHWVDVHHNGLPTSGALMAVSAAQAGQSGLANALIVGLVAVLGGELALAGRRRASGVAA